ncbi:hypothetical protein SPRG_14388 [Saprolegnia parasitica CBS 223.65]|uniref:SCP domain-containing protein n=1 Tax=Saprolegnia parasitica (strain CBS 223.65) TaxID=695850 RepID=A0A067BQA1_SAPPC|nr:hypothetical protein SPRG_14388 [Saprolegnia parasitica CBS 223.65]KDO18955.1 hypothetical protein SPRG_14388 [Saprolegnia parasitica CBS 223.65]|eukprot:XP_012210336.1 hypothetical protein SPRG_14388 [Saprolegnia parasitica CBS 223.65]
MYAAFVLFWSTLVAGDIVQDLFDAHNLARKHYGIPEFACLDSQLNTLSQGHADYEVSLGALNHDGFDARCLGVSNRVSCGENTLFDYVDDGSAMTESWMASPPHRLNILNANYTHAGFGVKQSSTTGKWFATALFASANPHKEASCVQSAAEAVVGTSIATTKHHHHNHHKTHPPSTSQRALRTTE